MADIWTALQHKDAAALGKMIKTGKVDVNEVGAVSGRRLANPPSSSSFFPPSCAPMNTCDD